MVGASFDPVAKNCAFATKYGYSYKLVSDPDKTLASYGAVDPDDPDWPRRISYLIGPDRRIIRAYGGVRPASHPAEVLADLTDHQKSAT